MAEKARAAFDGEVTTKLGRVSVNPRGEYSGEETYDRLDIVQFGGSGWLCLRDGTKATEPSEGETWMRFADNGGAATVETAKGYAERAKQSETAAKQSETAAKQSAGAAETAKTGAVQARTAAEAARDEAKTAGAAATEKAAQAAKSAETAVQYSGNPPKPDVNKNLWMTWDAESGEYRDTEAKIVSLLQHAYPSVALMEADLNNRSPGELAIIASSVEDEDNSKLFIRDTAAWKPLGDLSGVTGVGVRTFALTSGNHAAGTTDTYTMTLTDGREIRVKVYNGADGEGSGDMLASVYDTHGKGEDVYDYADSAARTAAEKAVKDVSASSVKFEDGTTFQQKLDSGELVGPKGSDGAPGATGPAGPNTVSTSTTTNITGLLKGNGKTVQQAVAGTDYATAEQVNAKAAKPTIQTVKLTQAGWSGTTQTLTCTGIVTDETKQIVDVAPAVANAKAYMDAGIYVSAIAANKLTFSCFAAPSATLTVYVSIQNVG